MSDRAAAQREARRRKITQNAQARMNKLLGRPDLPDAEPATTTYTLPSSTTSTQKENQSPHVTEGSPYNLRKRPQKSESPGLSPGPFPARTRLSPSTTTSVPRNRDTPAPTTRDDPMQTPNTHETGHISHTETGADDHSMPRVDSVPHGEGPSSNSFDLKSLELLRIVVCVITAFFSRYVLRFGFGIFIVESIFLPFFLMEAVFTYLIETYLQDVCPMKTKSTLMSAALMLCGIKPELRGVYNKIMTHVTTVASDFGLYFFSFLLWHGLLT